MSSTLDDYILPALDQAFQQPGVLTPQWQVDMQAAAQRTEALQVSAAERHFSGNWYQGIAHEHTGLIIAGRWMQTALMRAVGAGTSGWRLTQPAGGYIAGASLVCAIPERAGQPEQAASVATDLAAEVDAQLLLCAATGTVPSLRAAHQHAPFVGTDAFCGGQAVGSIWCTAATALISAPVTAEQIELRRLARTELVAAFIP